MAFNSNFSILNKNAKNSTLKVFQNLITSKQNLDMVT